MRSLVHASRNGEGPGARRTGPFFRRAGRCARYATALFDRRLVGSVFGGYRLEGVVGQGRFATCFAARPLDARGDERGRGAGRAVAAGPDSARVALKLVKPRAGAIDLEAVWAECAALSMLDHPGIPRWRGIVRAARPHRRFGARPMRPSAADANGAACGLPARNVQTGAGRSGRKARGGMAYFIVEDLCAGTSLERRLARGERFDDAAVAAIAAGLADIVAHTASRGVVHGDIRPANVLLADDGAVALVDFGLARFFDRGLGPDRVALLAADDLAGLAEVLLFLLYSDPGRIVRRRPGASWREELALAHAARSFLSDLFFDPAAFRSCADIVRRCAAAFPA